MPTRAEVRTCLEAVKAGDVARVEALLAAAEEPGRLANAEDGDGVSAVMLAVDGGHVGMIAPLVEAGADVHGSSPLMSALRRAVDTGEAAMVEALLRVVPAEGGSWSAAERFEAFEAASDANRPDLMDLLAADEVGRPDLADRAAYAAYVGLAGSLGWLLDRGVPTGTIRQMGGETTTLLHHAAGGGQAATAALLIDAGARRDATDARGRTPLTYAAGSEPRSLIGRVGEEEKMKLAREEGRVIYAAGPADDAAEGRADTVLALLLDAGADATLRDGDGLDALAVLRAEYGGSADDVEAWRRAGPDTLAADVMAMIDRDQARTMWREDVGEDEYRAARELVWAQEDEAKRVAVSMAAKRLRDAGATGQPAADRAVVAAVQASDAAALAEALKAGGSPTATVVTMNGHGAMTPIRVAAMREDRACLDLLTAAGASPDDGGRDGPPLIALARAGLLDGVRMLLDAGADPNIRDRYEDDPLTAAEVAGREEVAALLRERGAVPREPDQPFTPGCELMFTATELLVKADARATAEAVAAGIGGVAEHGVLGKTVTIGRGRGHLVVRLDGSAWSSVLMGYGAGKIPDDGWYALGEHVSRSLGTRAVLVAYEKVSSTHTYTIWDGGEEAEHFEEAMEPEAEYGSEGTWRSARGRPEPADMEAGHLLHDALAKEEGFDVFVANPGGGPGDEVAVRFPGERRRIGEVSYAKR